MTNNGIVTIHGKEYMTVARRLELAHEDNSLESVETEVLSHNPVVIKAKVVIKGKVYTGISSVNPDNGRVIEKQNPYEVAETSAVGRALGFAGYGLIESVASADELARANSPVEDKDKENKTQEQLIAENECTVCGQPAYEKKGISQTGKPYHAIFCTSGDKTHTEWLTS